MEARPIAAKEDHLPGGRFRWYIVPFLASVAASGIPALVVSTIFFGVYLVDPVGPDGTDDFGELALGIGLMLAVGLLVLPVITIVLVALSDLMVAKLSSVVSLLLPPVVILLLASGVTIALGRHWGWAAFASGWFCFHWLVFHVHKQFVPVIWRFYKKKRKRSK